MPNRKCHSQRQARLARATLRRPNERSTQSVFTREATLRTHVGLCERVPFETVPTKEAENRSERRRGATGREWTHGHQLRF